MTAGDVALKIWVNNNGYLLYDNYANQATSKLMDWEYSHAENNPKHLKVVLSNAEAGNYNLLSSTFNGWSDATVAPIDNGMYVGFQLAPTTNGVLANVFWGIITDVQPDPEKGTLTLVCDDLLQRYEGIKSDKVIFTNYRDKLTFAHTATTAGNSYYMLSVSDPNVAIPFSKVEFACGDAPITTGVGTVDIAFANDGILAQHWLNLEGDALFGVRFSIKSPTAARTLTVSLCLDSGTGTPGTVLTSTNVAIAMNAAYVAYTCAFTSSSGPYPVVPGQLYWLKFNLNAVDFATKIASDSVNPYSTFPSFMYSVAGVWNTTAGTSFSLSIDLGKYETVSWENCVWVPSLDPMIIPSLFVKISSDISTLAYITHRRGRLSYFYNRVLASTVTSALTGLAQPLSTDLALTFQQHSTYLNAKTYPIWRAGSNYVGASIRELADNFCVTSGVNTFQAAVGCYNSTNTPAGVNYLKWSRRQNVGDAAFMNLAVSGTDNEIRIVSTQGFRKSAKRPASVCVIGKDASGMPIVAHRDDRGLGAGSFRTKNKLLLTEYITDNNISTLQQADEIAKARLDLNVRDVWEGEVTISGTYPNLMVIDPTSSAYGSGNVVALTNPVMGMTAQKFKVKQVRCTPDTTNIQLSNYDVLLENKYNQAYDSAKRSETNSAPTDTDTNVFAKFYASTNVTSSVMYMMLATMAGADIGDRILCTRFADPTRKTVVYHAEFEAGNGTTTDVSTSFVAKVALFANPSGGVAVAIGTLGLAYTFPKWSGTRVIVDMACWDGT